VTRCELQPERKLKHGFSNSVREAAEDPFLEPAAPRCLMKSLHAPVLALLILIFVTLASAGGQKSSLPPQIFKRTRMDLIRGFNAELVYIRTPFPMGKRGLALKDGKLSPAGEELQRMLAISGPAAKPGDQARISQIVIKDDRIRFEIHGGPVKKQKWYQRISVGSNGDTTSIAPSDPDANPRGSYVDLVMLWKEFVKRRHYLVRVRRLRAVSNKHSSVMSRSGPSRAGPASRAPFLLFRPSHFQL
jgi:hypothetical protein